jgi:hypothetical protein
MATTTNSISAKDVLVSFEEAADRVRTLNEKLNELARKTGNAYLDAFDGAAKTQTDFWTELTSTYRDCHAGAEVVLHRCRRSGGRPATLRPSGS